MLFFDNFISLLIYLSLKGTTDIFKVKLIFDASNRLSNIIVKLLTQEIQMYTPSLTTNLSSKINQTLQLKFYLQMFGIIS